MFERGPLSSGHTHREGAAMSHYAGLDVSLEETAICVVDGTGRIVKEMRVPSEPEALVTALRETGLAFERIGDDQAVMPIIEPLLAILETMLAELARLTKQVLALARNEEICRRLMTVRGSARSPR